MKEAVWFEQDDDGRIRVSVRSERGRKMMLVGEPGDLNPTASGDHQLTANQSLGHNLWAYGGFEYQMSELLDEEARAVLRKKAEAHAEVAEQLSVLIDELGTTSRTGWCSNCFEKSEHRKVESSRFRTTTYLCTDCGSPTVGCVAPRCESMATRSLGTLHLPKFCAEHSHTLPSFERANDSIDRLEDIHTILAYDKPNLARGSMLGMTAVLAAGMAFPLAIMAAPAVGGMVGVLASQMGAGAALTGAAATNYGLALLGFGSIASGGLGMAGGTMVVSAVGTALGSSLGASVMNAYVRDDKSFKIELFREGVGTPVVIARGFTTENTNKWRDAVEFVETKYPEAPIYFLHWGAKELQDAAVLIGAVTGKGVGKAAAGGVIKKASKKALGKVGPLLPAMIAADLAKNPWHVARVRADKTGVVLAEVLARYNGDVILVGHSLGGRVMATAAQTASTSKKASRIKEIRLAGAAVGVKFDWYSAAQATQGKLFNYFSRKDPVLKYAFSIAEGGSVAVGLKGTGSEIANIVDVDVTHLVSDHSDYWDNTRGVPDSVDESSAHAATSASNSSEVDTR